jgi:hypothetical protein
MKLKSKDSWEKWQGKFRSKFSCQDMKRKGWKQEKLPGQERIRSRAVARTGIDKSETGQEKVSGKYNCQDRKG